MGSFRKEVWKMGFFPSFQLVRGCKSPTECSFGRFTSSKPAGITRTDEIDLKTIVLREQK